ncbi:Holliday junction resolvase RuvX [Rhodanobacter lindaniclasticus]
MSCVLGFDVGSRLTGVAIGNRLTATARALGVVPVREGQPDWQRLDALQREWQPDTLVVGLPLTLEGTEQPASRRARAFAGQLRQRYGVPVLLVDERHSSRDAYGSPPAGLRRRRDAAGIDAEAAAVILERWLAEAVALPLDDTPR